jgi:hypothetical protein
MTEQIPDPAGMVHRLVFGPDGELPPLPEGEITVTWALDVPAGLMDRLVKAARGRGVTPDHLARTALEIYVEQLAARPEAGAA